MPTPTLLACAPHPLLDLGAFAMRLARPLGELPALPARDASAAAGAAWPAGGDRPAGPGGLDRPVDDEVRGAVRALLRHGGYRPSGRGKPASEYLAAAAATGRFPSINPAVDACNVASLHAGLPISLVNLDRVVGALRVAVAPPGTTYPFNPSGQVIDASGLLCVWDDEGPTGTPVKDAQRTKTHPATTSALVVVWGTRALPGRTAATTAYYRALLGEVPGVALEEVDVEVRPASPG